MKWGSFPKGRIDISKQKLKLGLFGAPKSLRNRYVFDDYFRPLAFNASL